MLKLFWIFWDSEYKKRETIFWWWVSVLPRSWSWHYWLLFVVVERTLWIYNSRSVHTWDTYSCNFRSLFLEDLVNKTFRNIKFLHFIAWIQVEFWIRYKLCMYSSRILNITRTMASVQECDRVLMKDVFKNRLKFYFSIAFDLSLLFNNNSLFVWYCLQDR